MNLFPKVLMIGLMIAVAQNGFAQKSAEQLKSEREALKKELNEQKTIDRTKKLDELNKKGKPANTSSKNLNSLTSSSAAILKTTKANNDVLKGFRTDLKKSSNVDMKKHITNIDATEKRAKDIENTLKEVQSEIKKVDVANSDDIKKIPPQEALKAANQIEWSTQVLNACRDELKLQQKLYNHLIDTSKSIKP